MKALIKISKKWQVVQDYDAYGNQKNENNEKTDIEKKSHVGYYLIADGKSQLLSKLLNKKVKIISNSTKSKLYVAGVYILTIAITILLCTKSWLLGLLCFIPLQNVVTKFLQYVLSKIVKTKSASKIRFSRRGNSKGICYNVCYSSTSKR